MPERTLRPRRHARRLESAGWGVVLLSGPLGTVAYFDPGWLWIAAAGVAGAGWVALALARHLGRKTYAT